MSEERKKGRSRVRITPERRGQIIELLERWAQDWCDLTGPNLEAKVKNQLGWELSRIGMFKHAEIEKAFLKRQNELSAGKPPRKPRPADEEVLAQRVKRLEQEKAELTERVETLLGVIATHHYNAHQRGMKVEELEAPMPQARDETQFSASKNRKR